MRARYETTLVILAALVFGGAFSYPLLTHLGELSSFWDWDFATQLTLAAYRSIVKYHQLPLWNPWKCGGVPLLNNPQARILNPFFPLSLLFGPAIGMHLEVPLHLAVAWAGGYVLGRVQGMRWLGAAACASAFAASSWFPLHVAAGELVLLGFCYLPWLLAFGWLAIERRFRWVWPAAAVLALMWFSSGPYPPSFGALLLVLLAAALAVLHRSTRPLSVAVCVCALGLTLAAPSVVFSYLVVAAHPRPTRLDYSTPGIVWSALLSRDQDLFRGSAVSWGWQELGGYVGLFLAPGIIAGLLRPRRAFPWVMAAACLVVLALGAHGPWWPWPLLHKLPVFSWERLPYRFIVPLVQVVAVLAGFGTDWIAVRCGRSISAALVVVATLDCLWVGPYNLRYSLRDPVAIVNPDGFHQVREPGTGYNIVSRDMTRLTEQNLGIVNCYDYWDWSSSVAAVGDPGYRGENYLLEAGTVEIIFWSPNRLDFVVDASAPTALIVNQNYDRFWRLTAGHGTVVSKGGLLAVSIPAGRQRLQLSYW